MKKLYITRAEYASGFVLDILFNDGTSKRVDFENFLREHSHPQFSRYKNENVFRKFRIDMGNVVWGKNWDLIFPIEQLYNGL